jgi:hypothetical protein
MYLVPMSSFYPQASEHIRNGNCIAVQVVTPVNKAESR